MSENNNTKQFYKSGDLLLEMKPKRQEWHTHQEYLVYLVLGTYQDHWELKTIIKTSREEPVPFTECNQFKTHHNVWQSDQNWIREIL